MPVDTLDPPFFEQHVAQAKAAWRKRARSLTWEEKIAAIERMRERDAKLKKAREANLLPRGQIQRNAGKGDQPSATNPSRAFFASASSATSRVSSVRFSIAAVPSSIRS